MVLMNVWGKDDYFLGRSMDVCMTKMRKYFKGDPALISITNTWRRFVALMRALLQQ
jgi:hypothetical protein